MNSELSIIIVNWNSKDFLRACLRSLHAQVASNPWEIIVIDCASYDGASEMAAEEFPKVRFIQATENLGFARANNEAFEQSTGSYVLFLNPDTEVAEGAIDAMLHAIKQLDRPGAVGCRLLNSDGSLQTSAVQAVPTISNQFFDAEYLRKRYPLWRLWGMGALFAEQRAPMAVEMISGACLMVQREAFRAVGRFSEDYFMYAEDADLCYKLMQRGYQNYYVPAATVIHHGGGSSENDRRHFSSVMMRQSLWQFFRKTRGFAYAAAYRASTLISACGRLAILALVYPLRRATASWASAFGRWRAILRWSLMPQAHARRPNLEN